MNRQQRRRAAQETRKLRKAGRRAPAGRAAHEQSELESAFAHHRAGDLETAARSYRRILARTPRHAKALQLLGAVALQEGRDGEAVELLERSIALKPDDAQVQGNLGLVYEKQGRLEDAARCFARAATLEPDSAEAHLNLANILRKQDRLDAAAASYRRALALKPADPAAHLNLGATLQAQGRFDAAVAEYESALAAQPDFAKAYKALVMARKVAGDDPVVARIEALLRRSPAHPERQIQCHFALGKCFDDIGDYDRAFEHYRAANTIKKRRLAFDGAAFARETERIMATFGQAFFQAGAGLGNPSERPVFVVGMPRSGTTLVEQILASHPGACGAGELPDMGWMIEDLPRRLGGAAPYPECAARIEPDLVADLSHAYLARLAERSHEALRVIDKTPYNFRRLGFIWLLFPRARVIHCRREPLDVCLSCYFQDFASQPFASDLMDIALFYREYERLMAHWNTVLPLPVLDVRYEELVDDTEAVSRRIVEFCGLQWDPACLAFHGRDRAVQTASLWQVRQPIYRTSVQRWRRYEKHLGVLMRVLEGAA